MRLVGRGPEGSFNARFGDRSAAVRSKIARYMADAPVLVTAPSRQPPRAGTPERQVATIRSDGTWIWTDGGMRAFERADVDLEPLFVAHVIRTKRPPASLTEEQTNEAYAALSATRPSEPPPG